MYGSWDKKHKDRVFCHFGPFFYPLTLLTTQKIKILKKESLGILSVYTCVPQMMIIQCIVPEISSVTDRIICHFGLFSALLPLWQQGKSKFWKMKKTPGDIIILHMCSKNDDYIMYGSWDMVHEGWTDRWTERWTNGWMEKETYRGGCPT